MHKRSKLIYNCCSSDRSLITQFHDILHDIFNGRELAIQLAQRDILTQYRQAVLGLLWAFILPLANAIVWLFINGSGIITIQATNVPYPVFVFSGTILWSIFMESVTGPLRVTSASKQLLAKVNFPRESLILSRIYICLFNSSIKICILFLFLVIFGIRPGLPILFLPLAIFLIILTGTTVGLLFTPLGVLYTDIGKGIPVIMQFVMYLTPVVYPIPSIGWTTSLFKLNPLSPLILFARNILTGQDTGNIFPLFLIFSVTISLFMLGLLIYRRSMPILIERMSS